MTIVQLLDTYFRVIRFRKLNVIVMNLLCQNEHTNSQFESIDVIVHSYENYKTHIQPPPMSAPYSQSNKYEMSMFRFTFIFWNYKQEKEKAFEVFHYWIY